MKIPLPHPKENIDAKCSLVWRANPFTKTWEFWDRMDGYWRSPAIGFVSAFFGDVVVSYRSTWCEPIELEPMDKN